MHFTLGQTGLLYFGSPSTFVEYSKTLRRLSPPGLVHKQQWCGFNEWFVHKTKKNLHVMFSDRQKGFRLHSGLGEGINQSDFVILPFLCSA